MYVGMLGTIRFHYDPVNDIHFAYPTWYVETEEDCRVWFAQFEAYFSRFDDKVDVILILDAFRIGPKIGTIWGKYRSAWVSKYTRYSVRVHANSRVSTFNATSAAIHGGGYEEAGDVETAVGHILARRKLRDSVGTP
jgi:hypothetical protein